MRIPRRLMQAPKSRKVKYTPFFVIGIERVSVKENGVGWKEVGRSWGWQKRVKEGGWKRR